MISNKDTRLIAVFEHWELYLHEETTPYLGRCIAWAKRPNAQRYTDMTSEENEELRMIVGVWFEALSGWLIEEGQPAPYRENISVLGNSTPHLHAHLIPRYEKPVTVFGTVFTDPRPGHHYKPYEKKASNPKTVLRITEALRTTIRSAR